jgi:hypothetical protein
MSRCVIFTLIGLCCLINSICLAADWYVATWGNNGWGGSSSHPWRTINYAVGENSPVDPGDTIWLYAGDFGEDVSPLIGGSSPNALITIKGTSSGGVSKFTSFRIVEQANEHRTYWRLEDLEISGSDGNGIRFVPDQGSTDGYLEIINCTISNHVDDSGTHPFESDGISLGGPFGYARIENCDILDNGSDYDWQNNDQQHGIQIDGVGPGQLIVRHCYIADNYHKGIAYSQNDFDGDGSLIESNIIYNNWESGIDFSPSESTIQYNYIGFNGLLEGETDGDKGLMLEPGSDDNTVFRNIIRSSGYCEFTVGSDRNYIFHNTMVKDAAWEGTVDDYGGTIRLFPSGDPIDNLFRNNILVNTLPVNGPNLPNYMIITCDGGYDTYADQIWDYNLYYQYTEDAENCFYVNSQFLTLAELKDQYEPNDANSLFDDPDFVHFNPGNDFHVQEGSPAIAAGWVSDPEYTRPTIGRWEYSTGGGSRPEIESPYPEGSIVLEDVGVEHLTYVLDPSTGEITIYSNQGGTTTIMPLAQPKEFKFLGAYPNPFNPTTTLRFEIPEYSRGNLVVYNLNGAKVAEPLQEGLLVAGSHQITFDASHLPSGIYFAKLTAGSYSSVQKLVVMK